MLTFFIILIILYFVFSGKKQKPLSKTTHYQTDKYIHIKTNKSTNDSSQIKITPRTQFSSSSPIDNSIIDVGSQTQKIRIDYGLDSKVPYWAHSYVYSYSEINYASKPQKEFYFHFKSNFLDSIYLDIEGNTNYAFVLLFDLLNEFDIHKDTSKLERQLESLGEHYPKTKSYTINFLLQKMKDVGDKAGIERLREDHYDFQNTEVTYSTFEWRNKFKKKLNLKKEETKLLDKIWFSGNTFVNIDYCCTEIIKLYLNVIPKLEQVYKSKETTTKTVFDETADIVVRKHYRYRKGSVNYKYAIESTEHEFYTSIFKFCENAVRESYGNKRKITVDPYNNTPEAKAVFEENILNEVAVLLSKLVSTIIPPDEATEIRLNKLNTTRWRISFDSISSAYTSNPKDFELQIVKLGNLNKDNPSVENIFFEASKFITKYDKVTALLLYIHYIHWDLKSATFDNKQHNKSIQKSLFTTTEQFENFQTIVNQFIKDKDFDKALFLVSQVYAVKRKKIQLDSSSIKEVQQQHSGTVDLLNKYLEDENEIQQEINKETILPEEIQITVVQDEREDSVSIYSSEFAFSPLHISTLEVFLKNNYSLLQSEFEVHAKSNGAFKNQLIDTINEICYDRLDDLLIEEDEEYYTINQNYYHKLLAS